MLAPMQYRDFVWPNNPRVFEVEYRRTLHSYKLPFSGYVVQNLGLQNKIIRGEGEFVGPKAYESFRRLAALFEENKGGKLVHPVWPTMRAYFAKLSLRQEPKEDYISYSFEFWEYVGQRVRGRSGGHRRHRLRQPGGGYRPRALLQRRRKRYPARDLAEKGRCAFRPVGA